jgi:hypothetical protein
MLFDNVFNKVLNNKRKQGKINMKSKIIRYIQINSEIYKFHERFRKSSYSVIDKI